MIQDELERWVEERTVELTKANKKLLNEIKEHKQAGAKLRKEFNHLEKLVQEQSVELNKIKENLKKEIIKNNRKIQALIESEQRLKAIISSIDDLVFVLDKNGIFLDYHPRQSLDKLYIPPEKFLGKHFKDVLPTHAAKLLGDAIDPILITKEIQQFDYPLTIEGEELWFNAKVTMLKNSSGEFDGITILTRNITERKRMEESLKKTREQYRILYEENPSMYFTVNKEGTVISVNNFGATQLGYSVDELIGKSVLKVVYDDDKETVLQQLRNILQNPNQITHLIFRKVHKNGTTIWVKETTRVIESVEGETLVLIVCEDISEHLKSQIEKDKLLKQMVEREKLATLGQLTTAITHEINNPLDIIITEIETLQEDYHHLSELLTHTEKIKEQVFRINHLAGDILSYAKPQPSELHPIDVNKILTHTLELLRLHYRDGLKIETKLKPNLPLITADATGLEIVFKNIILNAMQSFKQEGTINISTQLIKDDQLRITIKDNGSGIEKSRLKKIFEQFHTSKQDSGGTGLGLAISLEIVKKHNGSINIRSQLGSGTTFHVYLPVHRTA